MPHRPVTDWTHRAPFPDATDLQFRIARSFKLITAWNAALTGQFDLQDVLAVTANQTGATNIALYRHDLKKAWPIATASRAHDTRKPETSSGHICRYLHDSRAEAMTPGSVWRLSELREEAGFADTAAGREWAARDEICEISVIVLEHTGTQIDALELWFETPPQRSPELPTAIITQAMADAWELRSPGLISCLVRAYGRSRTRASDPSGGGFLDSGNPCGLSRAEMRVCKLLVAGHKARDIAEALNLSVPTVRTHLHNIYSKTNTSGQIELIGRMNAEAGSIA